MNRIKELRTEYRMTQVRLAIELEVSQETVSAYEKEKHYPSFSQLVRLSEIFNASIDYIMGRSDVRNPELGKPENELQNLFSLCTQLNEKQAELVSAYARGVLDAAKEI